MIKSRRMTWAEHIARIGKKRNACRILVRKPERKRYDGVVWTGVIWLRIATSGGLL
jgi:hypothetical protein